MNSAAFAGSCIASEKVRNERGTLVERIPIKSSRAQRVLNVRSAFSELLPTFRWLCPPVYYSIIRKKNRSPSAETLLVSFSTFDVLSAIGEFYCRRTFCSFQTKRSGTPQGRPTKRKHGPNAPNKTSRMFWFRKVIERCFRRWSRSKSHRVPRRLFCENWNSPHKRKTRAAPWIFIDRRVCVCVSHFSVRKLRAFLFSRALRNN